MHRLTSLALVGLLVGSAACTKTEVQSRTDEGRVTIADLDVSVDDVECAEPGATLFATGVAAGDSLTLFDVAIDGDEAEATIRVQSGDTISAQHIGSGLATTRDGSDVRIEGTFVSFDGPTQTGDHEGTITFSCEPDTDPGGGSAVIDGQAVTYDLVSCVETGDSYEARARVVTPAGQPDPTVSETIVLHRALLRSGWVDRIEASGSLAVDVDEALDDPADKAVDVADGLFTVRGALVTAEGAVFGDGRVGSVELTCGIDVSVAPDE